jgi:general stress protein YciG
MSKNQGFASLSPEQRFAVASKGGKAAHAAGVAHKFTSEEARLAGEKGGLASAAKRAAAFREETKKAKQAGK